VNKTKAPSVNGAFEIRSTELASLAVAITTLVLAALLTALPGLLALLTRLLAAALLLLARLLLPALLLLARLLLPTLLLTRILRILVHRLLPKARAL
jgi:hypothetical protein